MSATTSAKRPLIRSFHENLTKDLATRPPESKWQPADKSAGRKLIKLPPGNHLLFQPREA